MSNASANITYFRYQPIQYSPEEAKTVSKYRAITPTMARLEIILKIALFIGGLILVVAAAVSAGVGITLSLTGVLGGIDAYLLIPYYDFIIIGISCLAGSVSAIVGGICIDFEGLSYPGVRLGVRAKKEKFPFLLYNQGIESIINPAMLYRMHLLSAEERDDLLELCKEYKIRNTRPLRGGIVYFLIREGFLIPSLKRI